MEKHRAKNKGGRDKFSDKVRNERRREWTIAQLKGEICDYSYATYVGIRNMGVSCNCSPITKYLVYDTGCPALCPYIMPIHLRIVCFTFSFNNIPEC